MSESKVRKFLVAYYFLVILDWARFQRQRNGYVAVAIHSFQEFVA